MSAAELTGFAAPFALAVFAAVIGLGGLAALWWDRRFRRRRTRLARVTEDTRVRLAQSQTVDAEAFRRAPGSARRGALGRLVVFLLPNPAGIQARIARAGMTMSLPAFSVVVLVVGALFILAGQATYRLPLWLAVASGIFEGYVTTYAFLGFLGHRRSEKFLKQLPDAIDIMVRSVRVGLPVLEGIAIIRQEFPDPIGVEFSTVRDEVHFGATLEDALWKIARRIDRAEFNFLVITVAIQRETGGNLTEALENLSRILRQREQMKLKIRALSSEARASAWILGALPFIMAVLVHLSNPGYLNVLITDPKGLVLVGAGLSSMTMGALVMAKMVRFKI
jgi:tight adherence protein B